MQPVFCVTLSFGGDVLSRQNKDSDLHPDRLFAVWVILLAMGVFSSFISSITATVSLLSNSQLLDTFASAKVDRSHALSRGAVWHGFGLD